MVHGHVDIEVRVHAQDYLGLGVLPLGVDRRHVPIPFRCRGNFDPRSGRERTIL